MAIYFIFFLFTPEFWNNTPYEQLFRHTYTMIDCIYKSCDDKVIYTLSTIPQQWSNRLKIKKQGNSGETDVSTKGSVVIGSIFKYSAHKKAGKVIKYSTRNDTYISLNIVDDFYQLFYAYRRLLTRLHVLQCHNLLLSLFLAN